MSQTSKINPAFRQQVIEIVAKNSIVTNKEIFAALGGNVSLRKIQEATQKLAAEGAITKFRAGAYTYPVTTAQPSV